MARARRTAKKAKPREVVNSYPVEPQALGGHIEVRGKLDGSWTVFYPDPGWVPCACSEKCKKEAAKGRPMIESNYKPTSYQDALAWARMLSESREIKVVAVERRVRKGS